MSRHLGSTRALHVAHKSLSALAKTPTPLTAAFHLPRFNHAPLPSSSTRTAAPPSIARFTGQRRYYGQEAMAYARREEPRSRRGEPRSSFQDSEEHEREEEDERESLTRSRDSRESDERLARYLGRTFAPLEFPVPLAKRILTHTSYKFASDGHNARLAFLGRRSLQAYFHLFLADCPSRHTKDLDFDVLTANALNTYLLGEHVAKAWELAKHIRWNSSLFHGSHTFADADEPRAMHVQGQDDAWLHRLDRVNGQYKRAVGLYKVLGTTVEATVGGVYHQFGGAVAHRIFHTHVLPYLLLEDQKEGLPPYMIQHAQMITNRMGGRRSPLLLSGAGLAEEEPEKQWAQAVM